MDSGEKVGTLHTVVKYVKKSKIDCCFTQNNLYSHQPFFIETLKSGYDFRKSRYSFFKNKGADVKIFLFRCFFGEKIGVVIFFRKNLKNRFWNLRRNFIT